MSDKAQSGNISSKKDKCSKHVKACDYRFSPLLFLHSFYLSEAWHPSVPSLFLLLIPSSALSYPYPPSTSRKQRVLRHCKEDSSHSSSISNTKSCNGKKQRKREKDREIKRERERPRHSGVQAPCWAEAILPYTILSLQTHRWGRREQKAAQSQLSPLLNGFLLQAAYIYSGFWKKQKACAIVTKGERGGWCSLIFTLDRNDWVRDDVIKRLRRTASHLHKYGSRAGVNFS